MERKTILHVLLLFSLIGICFASSQLGTFCRYYYGVKLMRCATGDHCIFETQLCDGINHCGDNSDESVEFCRGFNCSADEYTNYKCSNKLQCFIYTSLCNGIRDCDDGSDEGNMCRDKRECGYGLVRCDNDKCVYQHKFCDGKDDCGDNSDETANICPP